MKWVTNCRARAALAGRSLQEYLRMRLVDLAERPDADVFVARLRARKQATGGSMDVAHVLRHRDADRR